MSSTGKSLYRWKRQNDFRTFPSSGAIKTNSDIQDWIKTVEDASEKAAASAFGRPNNAPSTKHRVGHTIKARVEDAQIHEAAYAEAQDLLNQWVNEKIYLDNEDEFTDDVWTNKTETDIKREWDNLLSDEADLEIEDLASSGKYRNLKSSASNKDPYWMLTRDENEQVAEVLGRMYETDVIGQKHTRDLGLEDEADNRPDPRTKMQLRHQQVKENRERRLKEKEKKLKQLQSKKDANFQARQMLLKEEKVKENLKRKEELEIQQEMVRIKKEMAEERRKQKEERDRMRREQEEAERRLQLEVEQQRELERRDFRTVQGQAEDRRRQAIIRRQELQARLTTDSLKIKQKYFSAWYNVVIDRRLKAGKAKATCDWKILLRTFNAWKAFAREKRLSRETWAHEENVKLMNRKIAMADTCWRHTLLRKCVTAWQLFVELQLTERNMQKEQEITKNKMAAFLEAASSGRLWSANDQQVSTKTANQRVHESDDTVSALFATSTKRPPSQPTGSTSTSPSKTKSSPTYPWQVQRHHIRVTQKDVNAMHQAKLDAIGSPPFSPPFSERGQGDSATPSPDSCTSRDQAQQQQLYQTPNQNKQHKPWQKTPYSVNNFEHRHAAQQKILEMQQKQIKEQQRLIEELQYLQKQQMLQQQLLQQERTKATLSGTAGASGDDAGVKNIHDTLAHLQTHIAKLQLQLTASYDAASKAATTGASVVQDIVVDDSYEFTDNGGNMQQTPAAATPDHLKIDLSSMDDTEVEAKSKQKSANGANALHSAKSTGKTKVATSRSTRSDATSKVSAGASTARSGVKRHEQFLQSMGERAKERERVKREREEKKRLQEEVKLAELLAKEEEIRRQEEEEKMRRIEAHREKKRLEKQKEKEKQELIERMRTLNDKATEHYRRSLLKWRGLYAFQKLLRLSNAKMQQAIEHYDMYLQRSAFSQWHRTVTDSVQARNATADEFNNYLVVKRCFRNWTKYKEALTIQLRKAQRHHDRVLLTRVIRVWADFAADEKIAQWHRERVAKEHNIERIKKKYFDRLRKFPQMRQEEEERERRRAQMRQKVAHLLPDYEAVATSQSIGKL